VEIVQQALAKKSESIRKSFDADNIDEFTVGLINELGMWRFWCLLGKLLPDADGTIKAISPGRSGAYVFKATTKFLSSSTSATLPKSWIIKVCTDKDLIFKEVKNHMELVKYPIPRSSIPRLLHPEPKGESGLWGIVYEYEGEADTLLRIASGSTDIQNCIKIAETVISVLTAMYGDPVKKYKKIWQTYFSLRPSAKMSILSFLSEHKQVLTTKLDCIDSIENFIRTDGTIIHNYEREVDTRNIHGDLNCGNILISPEYNAIFIDFASRRQDHVVKDIAKLERDLLFRVIDAYLPEYYSWDSLPLLDIMSKADENSFQMNQVREEDVNPRHTPIILMIKSLRQGVKKISPSTEAKEYLCALLHYCLLGIAHPAISIHRKTASILYANNILRNLGLQG